VVKAFLNSLNDANKRAIPVVLKKNRQMLSNLFAKAIFGGQNFDNREYKI
jgi:hypothetical protein